MFSKKGKMAKNLEQVMADFARTKANVKTISDEHKAKRASMKNEKIISELSQATSARQSLEEQYNQLETLINNPLLATADRPNYETQRDSMKQALDAVKMREEALLAKKEAYTISDSDTAKLQTAQQEMQDVIDFFVGNPEINDYLQSKFKYEYGQKIQKYDDMLQESNKKYNDLASALQSPEFASEVDALKTAYAEVKRVQTATPGTIDATTMKKVWSDYNTKMTNLSTKLSTKGVFADISLMQDDYNSIAEGNYVIPSKAREEKRINDEKTALVAKRDRILAHVEAAKVQPTTAAPTIPQDLQDKITQNATNMAANQTELTQAQTELQNIANNDARLQALRTQQGNVATEKAELDAAERGHSSAIAALKREGFISKAVIPELNDANSDISKKYETYKKANEAVRKAMLEYQGEPTDAKKAEILAKAAAYKTVSDELKALSGMGPEAWNKYFMRELEVKSNNGEIIDPVFFDDTAMRRYDIIGQENKPQPGPQETAYLNFGDNIVEMVNLQNKILNGQPVQAREVDQVTKQYKDDLNELVSKLGISADKVLNVMKGTAIAVGNRLTNFFKKLPIIRRFTEKQPRKFTANVTYGAAVTDQAKNDAKAAYERYASAKEAYDNAINGTLSSAEQQELQQLETQAAQKTSLEQKVTDCQTREGQLQQEKAQLDAQVAALPRPVTASAEISDAQDIMHKKGMTSIINQAKKKFEDMER